MVPLWDLFSPVSMSSAPNMSHSRSVLSDFGLEGSFSSVFGSREKKIIGELIKVFVGYMWVTLLLEENLSEIGSTQKKVQLRRAGFGKYL